MSSKAAPSTPVRNPRLKSAPSTPLQPAKTEKELRDALQSPTANKKLQDRKSKITRKDGVELFEKGPFGHGQNNCNEQTKKVYHIIQKTTGALGGNGSTGAIYGELSMGSMQKLLEYMKEYCELDESSLFIDVGAGLGKPNFHAAQFPGVRLSIGIELEKIRYELSMQNLKAVLDHNAKGKEDPTSIQILGHTNFMCGDMEIATTTDPFTHVYQYDLGFPPDLQKKIAVQFNTSQHGKYFISYRPPKRVIEEYLYDVTFVGQMNTTMTGSGESHMCYFYKRASVPPAKPVKDTYTKLELPARHKDEKKQEVYCDNAFYATCLLAAALDSAELHSHAVTAVESYLNSARPKRERKQRYPQGYAAGLL